MPQPDDGEDYEKVVRSLQAEFAGEPSELVVRPAPVLVPEPSATAPERPATDDALRAGLRALEAQVQHGLAESDQMKARIESLESERASTAERMGQLEATVRRLSDERAELRQLIKELTEKLIGWRKVVDKTRKDLNGLARVVSVVARDRGVVAGAEHSPVGARPDVQ